MTAKRVASFPTTLVDLLKHRAVEQKEQIAYTFLVDGATQEVSLTYQELEKRAQRIAGELQGQNLPVERAILLYPPGLELIEAFFGCLYAGVIAIPVYPPLWQRSAATFPKIINDSQAHLILTNQKLWQQNPQHFTLPHLITDLLCEEPNRYWQPPEIEADSSAFIQYTSGSTGSPKGVMLTHGNLWHNLSLIYRAFEHNRNSKVVSWLPPYHDMGLIGGILQPFYGGFGVVLMSPLSFLRRPLRWLEAISRYRATTSGGPNFAYELCLEKITPEQRKNLDLSCWELAFIGAEPVSPSTLQRFAEAFAPCGLRTEALYPCYGLAEATLFVSGGAKNKLPSQEKVVSCGSIYPEQEVVIVDPQTLKPLSEGQVGEIWVSGASIAKGYWKQPEKTQETFQATLRGKAYLRTGDLGFLRDEELFVTGRSKDLIIIRGQNYYPQDLEQVTEQSHWAIRRGCSIAFSTEEEGLEKLVIIAESERGMKPLDTEEIFRAIRAAISSEFGLQVHALALLKHGSMPKTTSGKLQRYSCRQQFQENSLPVVARWPSREEQITDNLIDWLRTYAQERINSRLFDERRCLPPQIILDFGNRGLLGMQIPRQYGGLELDHRSTMRILEQLGAIDTTLALFVGLNNILGIRPLLQFGSPTLKEEMLPLLANGRELAAFALTEAEAGSNPQAIVSKAVSSPEGGWLLRGKKIWSGSAAWANIIHVFVKEEGQMSAFVVSQGTSGLCSGPEALTMGMRGMVQSTLYLNDVPVRRQHRLGEPGKGMEVAQDAMMYGRLGIAAACVGGMKRCAQLMLRYSARRQIATGKLADNPVTLRRLQRLSVQVKVVEVLVKAIAELLDGGQVLPVEVYTVCKIAAPEFYWQAADDLMQCLGGRGYMENNLAPQILRDARALRIFEGPTETLKMFLGSKVSNGSEGLKNFFGETLAAQDSYDQLLQDAQNVENHYQTVTAKAWGYLLIGDLATFALLLAVVRRYSPSSETARIWLQQQYQQSLNQALTEATTAHSPVSAIINAYTSDIGDIEQTLPGEDHALDDLLKKAASEITPSPACSPKNPVNIPKIHAPDIQEWLSDWLAQKLKIPRSSLDAERSFADYGVDSVIAVELAQDLQEWLAHPQELTATIAWNYPSIQALAQYLSQTEKDSPPPQRQESLQEQSEAQLQDSIAQEITELENWLQTR